MAKTMSADTPTSLILNLYATQQQRLPLQGKHVVAQQSSPDTIVVYQAYRPSIAIPAAKHQCFTKDNPDFKVGRMTWIKPGFLWMMYRSGWASKPGQEHILAMHIRKEWFMDILASRATLSSHPSRSPSSSRKQQSLSSQSSQCPSAPSDQQENSGMESGATSMIDRPPREFDVVVQWDPDHDWQGGKLTRRAIQIGLRGQTSHEFAQGVNGPAVVRIEDVTGFVADMRDRVVSQGVEAVEQGLWVPEEHVMEVEQKIREVLLMDD